jgi:hypothetical protein
VRESARVHVALLIQHATRMRHIVRSFVAPQAPPHFSTLSNKRLDFRKKKKCVFIFPTTFVQNISHSKKNLATYSHRCEKSFIWNTHYSRRNLTERSFATYFRKKKLKYQVSSKSLQWKPSCSMRAERWTDRQTDITKLKVAFRNSAYAPKIFLWS